MERTSLSPATRIGATVTPTSALLVDIEDRRGALTITNTDVSSKVFLGMGVAAEVDKGICIMPGKTLTMNATGCFSGDIYVIGSGTAVVAGQTFLTNN